MIKYLIDNIRNWIYIKTHKSSCDIGCNLNDLKYRPKYSNTDPKVGCGRYGVGIPCNKCPRNVRCWLD